MIQPKTHRPERMNSFIQIELNTIIKEYIEDLPGILTISRVETSKDLKYAKVWVSIVGGEDQKFLDALRNNIYHIQGELNHALSTKVLPRLSFVLDTSPRYAEHIDELLKKIHEEDQKN